jgi:endonuclease YncB( thermonuclease family)
MRKDGNAPGVRSRFFRLRSPAKIVGMHIVLLLLLLTTPHAFAQKAPSAKPFQQIHGCVLAPDKWTDGDSFRVRLPDGRLETFRLYYVDTTESRLTTSRSDEQAEYFNITRAEAVALGRDALKYSAQALERPFTVHTRWRSLFGVRWLGFVTTADGHDLGELLVRNGLARIYGVRTPLPDGRTSRQHLARLKALEQQAKGEGRGGWRARRRRSFGYLGQGTARRVAQDAKQPNNARRPSD